MKSMEKRRSKYCVLRLFLYAFCGALTALPLLFGKLWILAWIAPVPVIWNEFFSFHDARHPLFFAWLRGLLFFFAYGFVAFSWFSGIYPIDYLGYSRGEAIFVIVLAMTLLPLMQALFSALIFVFVNAVRKRMNLYVLAFCTAFLMILSEWLQTQTFAGIPWGRMAVGQVETRAIIQSASLFGSYFVTFIIVLAACLLAVSAHSFVGLKKSRGIVSFVLALSIFLTNYLFGFIRIAHFSAYDGDTLTVAAIQGNVQFEDKYYNRDDIICDIYKELTLSASDNGAELIVWPETAIPYDLNSYGNYHLLLTGLQKSTGADIMATMFISEKDGLYNAVFPVTDKGISQEYYSKRHLVPFGEYVPYESIIEKICPPLSRFAAIDYPLSAGKTANVFNLSCGKVSSLVCFDSIFEELCLEEVRNGSQLICISTNDSWFSGSAALKQHNYHSVLRCVECGRYGVRAANTGISSIISPTGEVLYSLSDSERGYITGKVGILSDMTLYGNVGNIIVPIGAAFVLAALCASLLSHKSRKNDEICN